jgi:hypothetical protein
MHTIIKITETLDNWGHEQVYGEPEEIATLFREMDGEEWSDDFLFETDAGEILFIDDLLGTTVIVGGDEILVTGI